MDVTFITGNQTKADYLAAYLGFPVAHKKVDLDEIQALDLRTIVDHKLTQAFACVEGAVLVEDVSLEFEALGGLPGPFIKWFLEAMDEEGICALLEGKSRVAYARCVFGYFDGEEKHFFEGGMAGEIASEPMGEGGFGWDRLFIPKGYSVTRAQMNKEDDVKTYQTIKPFAAVKEYLIGRG